MAASVPAGARFRPLSFTKPSMTKTKTKTRHVPGMIVLGRKPKAEAS